MKEKEVKKAIQRYFAERGFFVPPVELNIGVRPDVSAFKWEGTHEVSAICVECKAVKTVRSLFDTILNQAREYQVSFPHVYLATPDLTDQTLQALTGPLKSFRIGLLCVSDDMEVKEKIESNVSPRLRYVDFLFKVRQRAVAMLTYRSLVSENEIFDINVQNPEEVHCFMKNKAANYLLGTYPDGNYHFGICIEQIDNVRKTLGGVDTQSFHRLFEQLPNGYYLDIAYIDTYRPREVSWPVLRTKTSSLTADDTEWLVEYCKEKRWKVRLIIHKKTWSKYEVLKKSEHEKKVGDIIEELISIRHFLLP